MQGRSELRFIRGAPFLMRIERERLGGTLPSLALRPGGALAAAGRQQLVAVQPASVHVLDLTAHSWWAAAPCGSGSSSNASKQAQHAAAGGTVGATTAAGLHAAVTGRAVCGVGSKLLGFGGECEGRLLPAGACTQFLHPDLQAWLPAPPSADAAALQPAPRTAAALAHCPRTHAAFMYGGQGEGGALLGDLWRLDLGTLAWTRLDRLATCRPCTPNSHDTPSPAAGAALAVAPDGSRLWLMGGRVEGGRCSSTLHWCVAAGLAAVGKADECVTSRGSMLPGCRLHHPAAHGASLPGRFDLAGHYWAAVEPQTWCIDSRSQ